MTTPARLAYAADQLLTWGVIRHGTPLTIQWQEGKRGETTEKVNAWNAWLDADPARRDITWNADARPGCHEYLTWGAEPGEHYAASGLLKQICKLSSIYPYTSLDGLSFESPKYLILPGGVSLWELRRYIDTTTGQTPV
ncbi:hypothetical protein Q5762_10840 [Streptomyces sp. P9(2023)]|uniref:hypothetical protein n=1 Tax=Streptomyces sp. P9(2023) TaxID=3064394 RepID=UPI0028F41521|nr:hypothetical protein [Streptomyces sp. P9(2023)]MDT9688847.1 hypothetical protein [Streptomyces sp. P9(2023)]